MRLKILRSLLIIYLLTSVNSLFAQQENLDDLVPYKKGKLWGLVHHDMREFYKPEFDTVIIQDNQDIGLPFKIFTEYEGRSVAMVIYKGTEMLLTADKKLIPYKKNQDEGMLIATVNQEGVKDEPMGTGITPAEEKKSEARPYQGRVDIPRVVDWVYADAARKNKFIIKQVLDTFQFYKNGIYLPQFTCNEYRTCNNDGDIVPVVIISDGSRRALANLLTGKVTAFEYNTMNRPGNSHVVIVSKAGLRGVIDFDGKILVPVTYPYLSWIYETAPLSNLFIASDLDKKEFFVKTHDKGTLESVVKYDILHRSFPKKHIVFTARKGRYFGIVLQDDTKVTSFIYDRVRNDFYDRFLIITADKKAGFIDTDNNMFIVNPVYDKLSKSMKMGFKKDGKDYFLFLARKGDTSFYVDNFGTEFIAN